MLCIGLMIAKLSCLMAPVTLAELQITPCIGTQTQQKAQYEKL